MSSIAVRTSALEQSQLPASYDPVFSASWTQTGSEREQLDRTIKRWRAQGW